MNRTVEVPQTRAICAFATVMREMCEALLADVCEPAFPGLLLVGTEDVEHLVWPM